MVNGDGHGHGQTGGRELLREPELSGGVRDVERAVSAGLSIIYWQLLDDFSFCLGIFSNGICREPCVTQGCASHVYWYFKLRF